MKSGLAQKINKINKMFNKMRFNKMIMKKIKKSILDVKKLFSLGKS